MKNEMKEILKGQDAVLEAWGGHMDGFYLVGGTALSREYFHHRESYDLDFFTQHYSVQKIDEAVRFLETRLGKKLKRTVDSKGKGKVLRMRRYQIPLAKGEPLKIDIVQDRADLLRPFKRVAGIDVASLDDLYLRKLYAVTGIIVGTDALGRVRTKGKRQEARDLFDLYHLSKTFKRLSVFVAEYPEKLEIRALLQWYHSLNKAEMSLGLGDILTPNPVEFVEIGRHFRKEIDDLMREVIG